MPAILDEDDFEHRVLKPQCPVLVTFGARWSGGTQLLLQMTAKLWRRYADRVRFEVVDVDLNQRTAARYGVHTVPTMLLFLRGEVVAGFSCAASRRLVETQLDTACEEARTLCSSAFEVHLQAQETGQAADAPDPGPDGSDTHRELP